MEFLIGVTGRGFCILASNSDVFRSIVVMKSDDDKFKELTLTSAITFAGEPGDAVNFAEYVERNMRLETIRRYGVEPNVDECAAFTRKSLADALRSRTPWNVNLLIGGVDKYSGQGKLYWMDYLASMVQVPFGMHGHGAFFCSGLLDRLYKDDLTESEAMNLLHKCLQELNVRYAINLKRFNVRIIRANGIESTVLTMSEAA